MRSDLIKKGFERAPHRSLLRACGLKDGDFEKPFIGICNSFVEIIRVTSTCRSSAGWSRPKYSAWAGMPSNSTPSASVTASRWGMRNEIFASQPRTDSGFGGIHGQGARFRRAGVHSQLRQDRTRNAHGRLRVNIPSFSSAADRWLPVKPFRQIGGPDFRVRGRGFLQSRQDRRRRSRRTGSQRMPDLRVLRRHVHGQFDELPAGVLGLALPGNGTRLAVSNERLELVARSARAILGLVAKGVRPGTSSPGRASQRVHRRHGHGGSTNTVLHFLAIAREAGSVSALKINDLAEKVPHLCKISPASDMHIEDLDRAGGYRPS